MKIISILVALCFAFFAALQYNDPDPVPWILAYLAIVILSIGVFFQKFFLLPTFGLTLIYVVWGAFLFSNTAGQWWDGEVEREVGGLVVCASWCAVVIGHQKYFAKRSHVP